MSCRRLGLHERPIFVPHQGCRREKNFVSAVLEATLRDHLWYQNNKQTDSHSFWSSSGRPLVQRHLERGSWPQYDNKFSLEKNSKNNILSPIAKECCIPNCFQPQINICQQGTHVTMHCYFLRLQYTHSLLNNAQVGPSFHCWRHTGGCFQQGTLLKTASQKHHSQSAVPMAI